MKPGSLEGYGGQMAFAGVAAALALLTALITAGGAWAWMELRSQGERYGAYRDLMRNAGRADSLSAAYEALGRDLQALRTALPARNASSHVLHALGEEARKLQLGIAEINALDEVPFPGYSELPFEVTLTGEFPSLVRYLHSLESRGMAVQARRIEVRNESLNRARVEARLDLSVFSPAPRAGGGGP